MTIVAARPMMKISHGVIQGYTGVAAVDTPNISTQQQTYSQYGGLLRKTSE